MGEVNPDIVSTYLGVYYEKDYVFVAQRYQENAVEDLYYLSHVRTTFSDYELG